MDKKGMGRVNPDNENKPDKTPLNDAAHIGEIPAEEMNFSTARTVLEQLEMMVM